MLHGRYTITSLLEDTSDYRIYQAHDSRLERLVTLRETFFRSESFIKQFEFSAQLLSEMQHPVLPKIIDFFIQPSRQYLVMDYASSENLATFLERQPGHQLNERITLRIITPLLDVLEYLHSYNPPVIHRDIQPSNIVLHKNGIYLINFGIAKVYKANEKTAVGAVSATPGFSPIEQYGVGKTDERSDMYALGATMYKMITGVKPPPSPKRIQKDTLKPLGAINPTVSTQTEEAVMRLLAMQPKERYQDVASLRRALRQKTAQLSG
jgi:serine/threonine-protein kinase